MTCPVIYHPINRNRIGLKKKQVQIKNLAQHNTLYVSKLFYWALAVRGIFRTYPIMSQSSYEMRGIFRTHPMSRPPYARLDPFTGSFAMRDISMAYPIMSQMPYARLGPFICNLQSCNERYIQSISNYQSASSYQTRLF